MEKGKCLPVHEPRRQLVSEEKDSSGVGVASQVYMSTRLALAYAGTPRSCESLSSPRSALVSDSIEDSNNVYRGISINKKHPAPKMDLAP